MFNHEHLQYFVVYLCLFFYIHGFTYMIGEKLYPFAGSTSNLSARRSFGVSGFFLAHMHTCILTYSKKTKHIEHFLSPHVPCKEYLPDRHFPLLINNSRISLPFFFLAGQKFRRFLAHLGPRNWQMPYRSWILWRSCFWNATRSVWWAHRSTRWTARWTDVECWKCLQRSDMAKNK